MREVLDVAGAGNHPSLPAGFLGTLKQVALVAHDLQTSIGTMLRLGIGPWTTYTFNRETCTDLAYHGRPADLSFKIALADTPGMHWEIIQPLAGDNIYSDFLSSRGEGLHHLLFDCNGLAWTDKTAAFEAAGYACIQSGRWLGKTAFAYYESDAGNGAILEIVDIPPDWTRPQPDETYG